MFDIKAHIKVIIKYFLLMGLWYTFIYGLSGWDFKKFEEFIIITIISSIIICFDNKNN